MKTKTSMFTFAKVLTLCSASLFAACGGDDDTNPNPEPLAPPLAVADGTIDLACLNTASSDVPYAADFPVTLTTYELGVAARPAIPGSTVTAYSGTNFTTELDSGEANESGVVELVIPAGQTRISYKLEADGHLPTFSLGNYNDAEDTVPGASTTIANALPSFVQVTRTPGTGVLAGTAVDCQGRPVTNAFAVVSTTSGTNAPVSGSLVFYVNTVPVTTLSATNASGEFAVLQIPSSTTAVYIQTWGYLTQADADADELTLIGEVATPVLGDSVITAAIDVVRSN